jgi:hypothetical protein
MDKGLVSKIFLINQDLYFDGHKIIMDVPDRDNRNFINESYFGTVNSSWISKYSLYYIQLK